MSLEQERTNQIVKENLRIYNKITSLPRTNSVHSLNSHRSSQSKNLYSNKSIQKKIQKENERMLSRLQTEKSFIDAIKLQ